MVRPEIHVSQGDQVESLACILILKNLDAPSPLLYLNYIQTGTMHKPGRPPKWSSLYILGSEPCPDPAMMQTP